MSLLLPERFNAHFASRGWIAYEQLSAEVARAAVAKADAGDLEAAEQLLVEYYDETTLWSLLKRLKYFNAFKPRTCLLQLALDNYLAGRYHACVPVVLAQLDGVMNDISGLGFFAQRIGLVARRSIIKFRRAAVRGQCADADAACRVELVGAF